MSKKFNILIVDDTPENLQVLGAMLEQAGYEVRIATSGPEALQDAAKVPPDLILLDIMMPEMDGFEVCRRLKADEGLRLIPVIFISALGMVDQKLQAFREGAVDYVTKPFQAEEVLARVNTHVQLAQMEELRREIAARKVAEKELRKLSRAVEQSAASIAITDLQGNIEYVNPAFCRMTGYTAEELLGNNPRVLKTGVTTAEEYRILWSTITGGGVWTGEFCNKRKNGELYWERARIAPITDSGGGITQFVAVKEDITALKQAEEESVRLEEQLQQAQKMESVGRLAGGVAHDFNNILTVIHGYSQIAMMAADPAQKIYGYLEEILKAAERAAALTQQLLAFASKQVIAPKLLDLNGAVAGMLKMLQRLIGEDIQLTWLPEKDLWPVMMDPSQVDQLLANLCVNARDAIDNIGSVTIATLNCSLDAQFCAAYPDAIPGEYVLLSVSDSGCGMDEETMAKIFEPFFTTKMIGKGTGLGLATVFGIVKQNSGIITVSSEPGAGTKFLIYIPRHTGVPWEVQKEKTAAPPPRGVETILLVEDDRTILNLTALLLEKQGYRVLATDSPTEAVTLATEHASEIALLITDVIMPGMNGKDLAVTLKSLTQQLSCLFMSGYTSDTIATHGVLEEGVHFIQKPFSLTALAVKVREVLDRA